MIVKVQVVPIEYSFCTVNSVYSQLDINELSRLLRTTPINIVNTFSVS